MGQFVASCAYLSTWDLAGHGYWLRASAAPSKQSLRRHAHVWRTRGGRVKRILVVDDDPDLRDLLTDVLQEQYIVTAASNGAEALDAAGLPP